MDEFCISRGTLLDAPEVVTLKNPELHSYHCIFDVDVCINSGYEVLNPPEDGGELYCRRFRLDNNEKLVALGRASGSKAKGCTTCEGTGTGHLGVKATIVATATPEVVSLQASPNKVPPTISVVEAYPPTTTCASLDMTPVAPSCPSPSGGSGGDALAITTLQAQTIAHGSLMMLGWGVLIPCGVIIAALMRQRDPLWFKIHRIVQSVGLVVTLIAFIIAVSVFNVFTAGSQSANLAHGCIGIVVMIIGVLQPLNALLRPHLPEAGEAKSTKRKVWEIYHKGGGYLAVLLAVINIILGTTLTPWRDNMLIGYFVGGGIIIIGLVVYTIYDKKTFQEKDSAEKSSSTELGTAKE